MTILHGDELAPFPMHCARPSPPAGRIKCYPQRKLLAVRAQQVVELAVSAGDYRPASLSNLRSRIFIARRGCPTHFGFADLRTPPARTAHLGLAVGTAASIGRRSGQPFDFRPHRMSPAGFGGVPGLSQPVRRELSPSPRGSELLAPGSWLGHCGDARRCRPHRSRDRGT